MPLNADFERRMRELLAEEADAYLALLSRPARRALRVNALKARTERVLPFLPPMEPSAFARDGYLLPEGSPGLGRHPLHHAGAFYLQEASAAAPVTALAPCADDPGCVGERVLDLCAAPGGKAVQMAAMMGSRGLLWCNEVAGGRVPALRQNLERMGVRGAVVSALRPDVLCPALPGAFDKVLVDAPCSGEGMLRREPEAARQWSVANIEACARRQRMILDSAALSVAPGGALCYATCTFAPEENEMVLAAFLAAHRDFALVPPAVTLGRAALARYAPSVPDIEFARRILPMDGGEGQFFAVMRREGAVGALSPLPAVPPIAPPPAFKRFCEELFGGIPFGIPALIGEKVWLLPEALGGWPAAPGVRILSAGVPVGEMRAGRFEPSHALFAAADARSLRRLIRLRCGDAETSAFLRGHPIPGGEHPAARSLEEGYAGVAIEGVMAGFGKVSGGVCKNHYPKALRLPG